MPELIRRLRKKLVKLWNRQFAARLRTLRVARWTTRLLGFEFDRALRKIEIDITYACNLRCFNCNRSCTQAPTPERMTLEQIDRFVRESVDAGIRWERIRLLGGEPMLHPQLRAILQLLLWYRDQYSPNTVIEITTNGYGEKVRSALREISPEIQIRNTRKERGLQPFFQTFNVAPKDLRNYRHADFRNACGISHKCGIGLTPYGYYHCAIAGGIDRIFGGTRVGNSFQLTRTPCTS